MNEDDPDETQKSESTNKNHERKKELEANKVEVEIQNPILEESGRTDALNKKCKEFLESSQDRNPEKAEISEEAFEVSNPLLEEQSHKAKNMFINQLMEKMIVKNQRFLAIKENLETELRSVTTLSVSKVDEAFIEQFLLEVSSSERKKDSSSFKKMIEEYLTISATNF